VQRSGKGIKIKLGGDAVKASPTQLSLAHLRKTCDAVQVVEKWNPHARIRQDLFGFIDILSLRGEETIAVQSTSWGNVSSRARKIAESPLGSKSKPARNSNNVERHSKHEHNI
jgi:hypothetical protein